MRIIEKILFIALVSFSLLGFSDKALAGGTLSADDCNNNCQNIINNALSTGGTTYLKSGTYVISDNINITVDGTVLTGDKDAKIKLINNANWLAESSGGMIQGFGVSDVRITDFEIDGNAANNRYVTNSEVTNFDAKCGKYYYTMIYFKDSDHIRVDNMYLHDNWNDILKTGNCSYIYFHENNVRQPGHDINYIINSDHAWVYSNYMRICCNSGVRPDDSTYIYVYNNDIAKDDGCGGYAGIEPQDYSTVWICDNTFGDLNYDIGPWEFTGSLYYTGCVEDDFYGVTPDAPSGGGDSSSDDAEDDDSSSSSPEYSSTFESGLPAGASGSSVSPGDSGYSLDSLFDGLGYAPDTATGECTQVADSAGLVPCGKAIDDPDTLWSECAPCDACSLVLMGQLVIEFAVRMAGVLAVIAIVVAGFMHIVAAGKSEYLSRSNSMIKWAVIGFIIVFTAWLIVDTVLLTMGYIDPVDGVWYTVC